VSHDLRPLYHLHAESKLYPNAWRMVEQFWADRGKSLPAWPRWCFLPMAGWYAIISRHAGVDRLPIHLIPNVCRLAAIGTWRYSQGVYRLNPDFDEELSDTVLSGEIPVDVLLRLPEWCVYIETPGRDWLGSTLYGFWAHLEWDANTERRELRFLLDAEGGLIPFILHVGPWPVTEAYDRAVSEARHQQSLLGRSLPAFDIPANAVADVARAVQPLLSMVLYLCSDEPEIIGPSSSRPRRPQPTRTKHGWRLFPPPGPTIWRVGEEIGALLREARATAQPHTRGRSPRTHIRRAHWHGYWIGARDNRMFKYRWLSPIVVRGREPKVDHQS